ncbi:hypothetical protein JCM10296v2_001832 [Rhodotorula toruloides]
MYHRSLQNPHFCSRVRRIQISSTRWYVDWDVELIDIWDPEFWTFGGVNWRKTLDRDDLQQLATQRVEELVAQHGFRPAEDCIKQILRAYPNVRSVFLDGAEKFITPDDLVEAAPAVREYMLGDRTTDDFIQKAQDIMLDEALRKVGVRYVL